MKLFENESGTSAEPSTDTSGDSSGFTLLTGYQIIARISKYSKVLNDEANIDYKQQTEDTKAIQDAIKGAKEDTKTSPFKAFGSDLLARITRRKATKDDFKQALEVD